MKNIRIVAFGVVVAVVLFVLMIMGACEPVHPSRDEARHDINAMTFERHKNGLCFGVVRFVTYDGYRGTSITLVPDSACTSAERK